MMRQQEINQFLSTAIESSLYLAPTEPGLTFDELIEVGTRAGYQRGELSDVILKAAFGQANRRFLPSPHVSMFLIHGMPQEPDWRPFGALDFLYSQLQAVARSEGAARAQIEHSVLVERAVANGIKKIDIEAAVTLSVLANNVTERAGVLRLAPGREHHALPSQQRDQGRVGMGREPRDHVRETAYSIVKDLVARRSDGRSQHAEPLDALGEALDKLGYGLFRLWWAQTVAELRRADAQSASVSMCVLAGALVEGALTFVVKHARQQNLGVFRSSDFDGDPRKWRIDDLVASAASGGQAAILDAAAKQRADTLIKARQRIHAGRMLSEYPGGVPDLRPDEARDAKATAEVVVRSVLDWLEKYPPTS